MEQITVLIPDQDKAQLLIELLRSLDFISDVQQISSETNGQHLETAAADDFFSFAGLWSDREVSFESLRRQAWPGR